MLNIIGIVSCLLFVAISSGWRGRALPIIICIYYAIAMIIDSSQLSYIHDFADTVRFGDRDVADFYVLVYSSLAVLVIIACCLTPYTDRRNPIIPFIYAAWLLLVIAVNTILHLVSWDGAGVDNAIIGTFQLLCVGADITASMLGGDNFISRRFIRGNRHYATNHRRSNDRAFMAEF